MPYTVRGPWKANDSFVIAAKLETHIKIKIKARSLSFMLNFITFYNTLFIKKLRIAIEVSTEVAAVLVDVVVIKTEL